MSDDATRAALQGCLDVLLRMIPDYCTDQGAEPCRDSEHDAAIATAAAALYGLKRSAWPEGLRRAAAGQYA